MENFQKRHSSIRCVSAQTTLSRAETWVDRAGISRVMDITHLDRIGLPVFASVRPYAKSDIVTYGKGFLPIDAQVGAYMEAIEFYFAEPQSNAFVVDWGRPTDVVGADKRRDAILDFNPILNKRVMLNEPILLALAENIESGQACFVPAELVYHPSPPPEQLGQSLFGCSTNGLASGNSVLEASIHALAEVIERDIWSFEYINDAAQVLSHTELPDNIREVVEHARSVGLMFNIRYVPNHYGLAFFSVYLYEPENLSGKFFNGGWGCHFDRDIALMRAVCEAAQSRLAFIHGARALNGRSDFISPASAQGQSFLHKVNGMLFKPREIISYDDIPHFEIPNNFQSQLDLLIDRVRQVMDKPVCRVIYTPTESLLQVVRILVPTLEHFQMSHKRFGQRFKKAVAAQ